MSRAHESARQIALPLRWEADTVDQLIVTSALEDALAPLLDPDIWSATGAILTGPARSAKSLVGQWIAHRTNAEIVDDADSCDQEMLFHRWNRARGEARPFLMIARSSPGEWALSLADLKSRVAAALLVELPGPDEAMMRALLTHHLARQGATISDDGAAYAIKRIERSHEAAERFAGRLNDLSLAEKKPIGLSLIRRAVEESATGASTALPDGL